VVETATDTPRWGDKLVFRVGDQAEGGKMFCQIDFETDGRAILSLAAGPQRFYELIERDGIMPAPYRARLQWIALERWNAVGDAELKDLLRNARDIIFDNLPKHTRIALVGREAVGPKTRTAAKR
jgi:predicted DNA-binding protein (MmcQ/YjbR family)